MQELVIYGWLLVSFFVAISFFGKKKVGQEEAEDGLRKTSMRFACGCLGKWDESGAPIHELECCNMDKVFDSTEGAHR